MELTVSLAAAWGTAPAFGGSFVLLEQWIYTCLFCLHSRLLDRRNVDIVVVRAMADKRKLQGKTAHVALDPV